MAEAKHIPDGSVQSINEPPGSNVRPVMTSAEMQPVKAKAASHAPGGRDPDDLEDEIEAAKDDDEIETKHGGKTGKKR